MRVTLFQRLALRLFPGAADPRDEAARARVGLLEGWVSLVINILLAAVKGTLAWISGSLSLLADAFHTLAASLGDRAPGAARTTGTASPARAPGAWVPQGPIHVARSVDSDLLVARDVGASLRPAHPIRAKT